MIIKITKSQWQEIGEKTGWIKKSNNQSLTVLAGSKYVVPRRELARRLKKIGWDLSKEKNGDYMAIAPDGIVKVTIVSAGNWDKSGFWAERWAVRQNPDLAFVFDPIFVIPKYFNIQTQKIETPKEKIPEIPIKKIPFATLPPKGLIFINNQWNEIADVDYGSLEVLLKNNQILSMPSLSTLITYKAA